MSGHGSSFDNDTYLKLEGAWVIHRYQNKASGTWYAGARHRHNRTNGGCSETNAIPVEDAWYGHLNCRAGVWYCMVCKEVAPEEVMGMQALVQWGNRIENGGR